MCDDYISNLEYNAKLKIIWSYIYAFLVVLSTYMAVTDNSTWFVIVVYTIIRSVGSKEAARLYEQAVAEKKANLDKQE